jgi:hypothetical protein
MEHIHKFYKRYNDRTGEGLGEVKVTIQQSVNTKGTWTAAAT